jgi:hypothetical protein
MNTSWFGEKNIVAAATVVTIGFVLASIITSYAFYRVHTLNNTIVVTGSATRDVVADGAKWTIGVNRSSSVEAVSSTKSVVAHDSQAVVDFLRSNGVASDTINMTTVFADQNYEGNGQPRTYNVHRDIIVDSKDPTLIKKLANTITSLQAGDSVVSAQAPDYYISSLSDVRVSMIADAVKDAQARATQIVATTHQQLGLLQSASSGVVQVLAPHSGGDVSDYGTYDTSTINKTVMVTTRVTFYLR